MALWGRSLPWMVWDHPCCRSFDALVLLGVIWPKDIDGRRNCLAWRGHQCGTRCRFFRSKTGDLLDKVRLSEINVLSHMKANVWQKVSGHFVAAGDNCRKTNCIPATSNYSSIRIKWSRADYHIIFLRMSEYNNMLKYQKGAISLFITQPLFRVCAFGWISCD